MIFSNDFHLKSTIYNLYARIVNVGLKIDQGVNDDLSSMLEFDI